MKQKKIGLLLLGDYGWVGGLYYILNIIKTLNCLKENERPQLVIFYNNKTPKEILYEIKHFNILFHNIDDCSFFYKVFLKLYRVVFRKNIRLSRMINAHNIDAIYPFTEYLNDLELNCDIIYWIYDLQHKYLPKLFSQEEINKRDIDFANIATYAKKIVFSSNDSMLSFKKMYPNTNASLYVLQFVSHVAIDKLPDFSIVQKKYSIHTPYFIVANQFWQHKNHMVVLKAITRLKDKVPHLQLVFTGAQNDHRNASYFKSIMDFISENKISKNVLMTGFIPRQEQLSLMMNSIAVIQPSKFEGWSTVVEDAKVLAKTIILSDIPIHREQIPDNAYFFNPEDTQELEEILYTCLYSEDLILPQNDNIKQLNTFINQIKGLFTIQ
jgi:glycosyltransferase involved in cell wall biosynthesis